MWPFKKRTQVRNGSVEETRDRHASDLNAGIRLPPPPPADRRFYQFLTKEGQDAVKQGSGRLYELLVKTVLEMNADCFDGVGAVQILLRRMVWPPESLEDLFRDFPHIPKIATHVRFDPDGDWIPVLEADLERYLKLAATRASLKRAFVEQFGDVERFRQFKARLGAEGGTVGQFEEMLRLRMEQTEKERLHSN